MKMNLGCLLAAGFLASLQLVSAADITGKISLKGTPPPEKPLPLDPSCGKLHTDKPTTRFYVVGKDGGLADTFVYIKEGLTGQKFQPAAQPVELDQKGCEYIPYVLGLQTSQKLLVKNSDPLLHNVHPTPMVPGNKESNRAQLAGAKPFEYVFEKPEVLLRFKCDVHPWMFAYVGVLEHPFYSVSGTDGTFKISNLPPGKYTLEAYHRKAGKAQKEITVGTDNQEIEFSFDVK
jgi:hypothetical protein